MKIRVSAGIIGIVLMLSTDQSWAVTLKLSHNQDRSHPVHKTMESFAEKSEEYSNGDITIRIYSNGALGTQRETMELIRSGATPLIETNAVKMEMFENSYKSLNLPCLFRDRDHYYQVMQGDIGRRILGSAKNKGYFGLTFYDGDARSFYGNKPVLKPDDLKDMKVRVQPNPGVVEMIKVIGGNPMPLDYGKLYTALQQDAVDMAENSVMTLATVRHGGVAKSFNLGGRAMVPDVILMSNAAFDRPSPENQAVILKVVKESTSHMKDLWSEEEKQEFAELDKVGVKVYQADKTPFIEKVQPMCANSTKDNSVLTPMLADIQTAR